MLPPFLLLPFFRSSCCCSLFICCPSVLSSSSPRVHPHRPQGEEQTSGKFCRKRESQELRKYVKVNQDSRLPHWTVKSEPTWASPGYLGSVLSLEDVYQLLPGEDYNMILRRRCESCVRICEVFGNTCNHIMKRVYNTCKCSRNLWSKRGKVGGRELVSISASSSRSVSPVVDLRSICLSVCICVCLGDGVINLFVVDAWSICMPQLFPRKLVNFCRMGISPMRAMQPGSVSSLVRRQSSRAYTRLFNERLWW